MEQRMPRAVANAAAVAHQGSLYLIGGSVSDSRFLNTLLRYDTGTQQWNQLASMTRRRQNPRAVVWQDAIIVCGGIGKLFHFLRTCESYDVSSDKWSDFPSMKKARSAFGMVIWRGTAILAISGENHFKPGQDTVEKFDFQTGSWQLVPGKLTHWRRDFAVVEI